MITIGRMPRVVNRFYGPTRPHFSKAAWPHFWRLVIVMAMAAEHTLERLNGLLRSHTHRTNDGEFLWRSDFDEAAVLQGMALRLFQRVWRPGEPIYFILDDTQRLKRAKKMEAVRYRAVVRYLHLVDSAWACLTHLGLDAQCAQGQHKNKNVLRLPLIRQLKADLRQAVWNETIKDVVKASHEHKVIRRLEKLLGDRPSNRS